MSRVSVGRRSAALVVFALVAGACSATSPAATSTAAVEPRPAASSTTPAIDAMQPVSSARAYVEGDRLIVEHAGHRSGFLAGVNLGVTIPGHYPGELAIGAEVYRRWFPMMTDLGIRTVRVYTIQRPHFYEELRAYNVAHPEAPLHLIQGVWIDEERFLESRNLYDEEVTTSFRDELTSAVAAVTGSATLPERPGHASGRYTADASPWLVGWIIGIELDPMAVHESDLMNAGRPPHKGPWFSATDDATPTESWYAEQLDHLAGELAAKELSMPLAFTNWPTTDPLDHPYEPIANEDLVAIDPNHVGPEPAWRGGYFASYHAYPYYPDFQRFDPALSGYQFDGRPDPYAGYLAALKEHHVGLPVVIAEFGVPGGMALAHRGPLGRDQGAHTEKDQMRLNAEMLEVIRHQGLAGGLLFEWADEWFKRTWNTINYEMPSDRRALWLNAFNNESQFGLLAIHPGAEPEIVIDGSLDDWNEAEVPATYASDGAVREVRATHDAAYLYLSIRLDPAIGNAEPITIGFDVLAGESGGLPESGGMDHDADYAAVLGPGTDGRMLVRASNDVFSIPHGLVAGYVPAAAADFEEGSGVWNLQRLLTSYPLVVPATEKRIPAETFEIGNLVNGTTDPSRTDYDSRASWVRDGATMEVRVPYSAIGVSDPSSRQAVRVGLDGTFSTVPFDSVGISVVASDELHETAGYGWEPWDRVDWHERLRVGVGAVAMAMAEANASGAD